MSSSDALLSRLRTHLQALEADSAAPLDERLLESCCLALAPVISQNDSISTITELSKILPTLQTDPTPAIQFLILLLEPYSFSDILSLQAGVDFAAGLNVYALPYNRLMLALLKKATYSATDAATIAAQPEVVTALVQLWLCTQEAGVATEAGNVFLALLKTDQEAPPGSGEDHLSAHNQGLMWKRVFGDKDIYALIFSVCSLQSDNTPIEMTKGQKTLAQARLLEWLPLVGAMNWNSINHSHHAELESQYVDGKGEGLLYFAAACMVDTKEDVLMHRCLVDFYADLLKTIKQKDASTPADSSVSLDFLMSHGLHAKSLSFYVDPENIRHDPLDLQFLYAPSAHYLAVYVEQYPNHFLSSSLKQRVIARLQQSLDLSPARWAHSDSPKRDLHLLASLPRACLLPESGGGQVSWNSSPLALIPSKLTNADALNTLATIFRGPTQQETITYPPSSPMTNQSEPKTDAEAQAARALYYLYLNYNPTFFADLVKHAETIALEDQALAAVNVVASIIKSHWLPLSETAATTNSLPAEKDLLAMLPNPPTATPATGALAILTPPSLEHSLPYLLRPPQTFSNLVGGVGDTENSAYKVAMAKFDALKALHERVKDMAQAEPGQGYEEIAETLVKRIAEGPWSRSGEVGGRIATMEL